MENRAPIDMDISTDSDDSSSNEGPDNRIQESCTRRNDELLQILRTYYQQNVPVHLGEFSYLNLLTSVNINNCNIWSGPYNYRRLESMNQLPAAGNRFQPIANSFVYTDPIQALFQQPNLVNVMPQFLQMMPQMPQISYPELYNNDNSRGYFEPWQFPNLDLGINNIIEPSGSFNLRDLFSPQPRLDTSRYNDYVLHQLPESYDYDYDYNMYDDGDNIFGTGPVTLDSRILEYWDEDDTPPETVK